MSLPPVPLGKPSADLPPAPPGDEPIRRFVGTCLDGKRVLDLGCGDCSFVQALPGLDRENYRGLEKNPEKVRRAREKGYRVEEYDLECGRLPFPEGSFDAVLAKSILEHLGNFLPVVRECHRVLSPKGLLVVSVPSEWSQLVWDDYTHKRGFSRRALGELLKDGGFAVVRWEIYQDLCNFSNSKLKYTGRLLFRWLTGLDFITQGYLVEAERR